MAELNKFLDPELLRGAAGETGLPTPQPGAFTGSMKDLYEQMTQMLQSDALKDVDPYEVTDFLRSVALTRVPQIQRPVPSVRPDQPFESPAQEMMARFNEAQRLRAEMGAIKEIDRKLHFMRQWQQLNPRDAEALGVNDSWLQRVQDTAVAQAKRGYRALDILLRNLDRGRGAISSASLSIMQGGTKEDAARKAYDALRGSTRGWKWVPEAQGPTFREVLTAAGLDDDLTTKALGFTMDVLVDPVNLLGIGASRKGIELGAHQILNAEGRQVHGQLVRKWLDDAVTRAGVQSEMDLPEDVLRGSFMRANDEMRQIINSDEATARQYLDFGGLKIAGMSLTPRLGKLQTVENGRVVINNIADSLPHLAGRKFASGVDRLGTALLNHNPGVMRTTVGKFMVNLPQNLREAGRMVALLTHRTNPLAPKDYKWFKTAEFYEKLGWEELRIKDKVHQTFAGLDARDLEEASINLERGTTQQFIEMLAQTKSPEYAQTMAGALDEYKAVLDKNLIEEVQYGFFGQNWTARRKQLFAQWVVDPNSVILDEQTAQAFAKIRRENYVPHVYQNKRKAMAYAPPDSTPRAPSVTEVHTYARKVETLDQAIQLGLVPELNLAKLMALRLVNGRRAIVTHDFLREVAQKFGHNASELTGASKRLLQAIGEPSPRAIWQEVAQMRRTASGRLPLSTARQVELARAMAHEREVPPGIIAAMDDTAKRVFLEERFRVPSPRDADRIWKKYVEEPTRLGLYDGYKVAPGSTADEAVAAAKNLNDPNYVQWGRMTVGGVADPRFLSKVHLPQPIIDDLERLRKSYGGFAPEMATVLKATGFFNFWWKKSVTLPWPAFHFRNKLSNIVNSTLEVGVFNTMNRALLWNVMNGGEGVLTTQAGVRYSASQLRQLMRRLGIIRPIYRRHDVTEMLGDVIEQEGKNWARKAREWGIPMGDRRAKEALEAAGEGVGPSAISNPLMAPFRAGADLALSIDNADRAQLFMQSLKRGMSPEQAARRVNEFLFDYDDLGMLDRQFIRRFFFPFWTWTRKNLALQAKTVVRQPGRFAAFGKFARAFGEERDDAMRSDVERTLLPQFMNDAFGVRVDASQRWAKYLMGVDLPAADLNRFYDLSLKHTAQNWMAQLQPHLRTLLEWTSDMDFFRGKSTVDVPQTPASDILLTLPKDVQQFLELKPVTYRDTTTLRMNAAKWRAFMTGTFWLGSRFYSTVGKFADPRTTKTGALFNWLTGMKMQYVRPDEELRRIVDNTLFAERVGMRDQLREKAAEIKRMMMMKHADADYVEKAYRELDEQIETPTEATELPDEGARGVQF